MLPFLQDQARLPKLREVERQRTIWNTESIGDRSGRQTLVTCLNKQAEQSKAMLLRERAKRFDCESCFHRWNLISN